MRKPVAAMAALYLCVQSGVLLAASPLVGTSLNGTPLADQFAGVDMCAKIAAAIASLPTSGAKPGGIVDATHFTGTQACGSDPSMVISGSGSTPVAIPVVVEIGNVTMQLTVPWNIQNSLFKLHGSGPGHSAIQYVGTGSIPAIITFGPPAPTSSSANFTDTQFEGFNIWGNSSVTDAILLQGVQHSQFRDLSIWSVTNCGLHSQFAVTDTFTNIHVTIFDAEKFGMLTSPAQSPAHGLCFDQLGSGNTTTDGTVTDSEVEGVSGSGWYLPAAATMHFSAGTSESNGKGIEVAAASFSNTFTNPDLEANTQDVLDNGANDVYVNPLSTDSFEFGAGARHDLILGGTLNSLAIDSGATAITFNQTSIGNNGGTVTNNGAGTNNAASAGFAALSLPVTDNAAITVDPLSDLFAVYYFAAGSVTQFSQASAVTSGQPWKALFVGFWANNFEGGGLNTPAEVTEVTSASPSLNIGSIPLAFSVNSSGHLQAANGNASFGAVFSGHVIVIPQTGLSSVGTHSVSVRGSISASTVETTNGTPASSSATCEANGMWADANYVYVCVSQNVIKRVLLSSF